MHGFRLSEETKVPAENPTQTQGRLVCKFCLDKQRFEKGEACTKTIHRVGLLRAICFHNHLVLEQTHSKTQHLVEHLDFKHKNVTKNT